MELVWGKHGVLVDLKYTPWTASCHMSFFWVGHYYTYIPITILKRLSLFPMIISTYMLWSYLVGVCHTWGTWGVLLPESFFQLRNSVPLSWGCPHQVHLSVYSPGSLLELGPRPAILHVPCDLCSHQMSSVLFFSYHLLCFLTFRTWFARHEVLKAPHFSSPPSFASPTRLFFPVLLGSLYFSIYLAHTVCG